MLNLCSCRISNLRSSLYSDGTHGGLTNRLQMAWENIKIFDWNRAGGRIDTSGTRYHFKPWSEGVWVLGGNENLLKSFGLKSFHDFFEVKGEIVDVNPRSRVIKALLGPHKGIFYLKLHKDYVKSSLKTFFRPIPMVMRELENLMHYARLGYDHLEPVAWGWRPQKGGGDSFLLVSNLEGFTPLSKMLSERALDSDPTKRSEIRKTVAELLSRMHRAGLAHVDLFSWHIFLKRTEKGFIAQPIDLERTRVRTFWPWSSLRFRRKKASDLAALHLTVLFPDVGYGERLNFFLQYSGHRRLDRKDRSLLKRVIRESRRRGVKNKFKPYGIAERLPLK